MAQPVSNPTTQKTHTALYSILETEVPLGCVSVRVPKTHTFTLLPKVNKTVCRTRHVYSTFGTPRRH